MTTEQNEYVRDKSAGLLSKVKEKQTAAAALLKALRVEPTQRIRLTIIQSLGELGPIANESEKLLTALASGDSSSAIRDAASNALKRIHQ